MFYNIQFLFPLQNKKYKAKYVADIFGSTQLGDAIYYGKVGNRTYTFIL